MAKNRSATSAKGLRGKQGRARPEPGQQRARGHQGVQQVRRAKGTHDKLNTADAVAGLLPLITSAALVLRQLRGRKQENPEAA